MLELGRSESMNINMLMEWSLQLFAHVFAHTVTLL